MTISESTLKSDQLNQTPILNTYYNCEDHWLKQSMVFNTFLEEPNMELKNVDELKLALVITLMMRLKK